MSRSAKPAQTPTTRTHDEQDVRPKRERSPHRPDGARAGLPLFMSGGDAALVQTKLAVNEPGDVFEQQADAVAAAASSSAPAPLSAAGTAGTAGAADDERTPAIQRRATSASTPSSRPSLLGTSAGAPLSDPVRQRVEPILGTDLGHVRVHSDARAHDAARALSAKAFTHGSDIWLGPGARADDVELMAHEATHVVQQGAASQETPRVQRKAEPARTSDGEEVRGKMMRELAKVRDDDGSSDEEASSEARASQADTKARKPDPAELAAKRAELEPEAKPPVDRAAQQRPVVEGAAAAVKEQSDKPAEVPAAPAAKGAAPAKGGKGTQDPATAAAAVAAQTFAAAAAVAPPSPETPVVLPEPVIPVDAGGKPLPGDPIVDAQVLGLATAAQALRDQGTMIRARAAEQRANAAIIHGNIQLAAGGVAQSELGVAESQSNAEYRRDVVGKADGALAVAEEKAETVATGAPGFVAKGTEGKEQSSPMAGEAKDLAAQNASATPDDEEAAAKSSEQGGKINAVGSDIGTMDDAMTQTTARAEGLVAEAAEAKESNAQTSADIASTNETLDQTEARLDEMKTQGTVAKMRLQGLEGGPSEVEAGADALDQEGLALIEASYALEADLHGAQERHAQGMQSIPAATPMSESSAEGVVQREPAVAEEKRYDERVNLDLGGKVSEALPSWLTGEEPVSAQARAGAAEKEKKRRADEIQMIEDRAGGHFERLSAADKAGIALELTSQHLFGSVADTNWPDFLGHMARGLYDPRVSLMGIVSGLSMAGSGVANLLSLEQWKADPIGNLLKSAADIATGITIVLGAITGLALAIIVIMIAAAIFSFGLLGPVAAAVIPVCSTIVSVVGGWTITAAAIALELQELVFIKNLIDAATAKSSKDLQNQADQMTDDAKNGANMAMQIGMASVMEAGGEYLGGTRFGQAVASEAQAIGKDFNIVKAPPAGGGAPPPATPVAEPVAVAKPTAEPVPVAKPTTEPVAVATPVAKPVAEPVPVAKPVAEPIPVAKPAAEPVTTAKPAAEPPPVKQPVAEPAPVKEPPTPTTPKVEEPAPKAPKVEEPTPKAPKVEEPTPTAKKVEEPAPTEQPKAEDPAAARRAKEAEELRKAEEQRAYEEEFRKLEEAEAAEKAKAEAEAKAFEEEFKRLEEAEAAEKARAEEQAKAAKEKEAEAPSTEKVNAELKQRLEEITQERIANDAKIKKLNEEIKAANKESMKKWDEAQNLRGEKNAPARAKAVKDAYRQARIRDELQRQVNGLRARNTEIYAESNIINIRLHPELQSALPCFSADTLVATPDGARRIDQLQAGDIVNAFDFASARVETRRVTSVSRNRTAHFYEICVGGEIVQATGAHRFWVESSMEWVPARELRPGMELRRLDGSHATIDALGYRNGIQADSFNLRIDEIPNYFVGVGILVHNGGAPTYPFGNYCVYEGRVTTPGSRFAGKVYIGKTDDIIRRGGEHKAEALRELENKANMTPEEVDFWEFKAEMDIEARVKGLNADQATYLEQKNIDLELTNEADAVMNRKLVEVSEARMKTLEAQIAQDPAVREAKLCP